MKKFFTITMVVAALALATNNANAWWWSKTTGELCDATTDGDGYLTMTVGQAESLIKPTFYEFLVQGHVVALGNNTLRLTAVIMKQESGSAADTSAGTTPSVGKTADPNKKLYIEVSRVHPAEAAAYAGKLFIVRPVAEEFRHHEVYFRPLVGTKGRTVMLVDRTMVEFVEPTSVVKMGTPVSPEQTDVLGGMGYSAPHVNKLTTTTTPAASAKPQASAAAAHPAPPAPVPPPAPQPPAVKPAPPVAPQQPAVQGPPGGCKPPQTNAPAAATTNIVIPWGKPLVVKRVVSVARGDVVLEVEHPDGAFLMVVKDVKKASPADAVNELINGKPSDLLTFEITINSKDGAVAIRENIKHAGKDCFKVTVPGSAVSLEVSHG